MSRALNQLSNMNARSACPKCDGKSAGIAATGTSMILRTNTISRTGELDARSAGTVPSVPGPASLSARARAEHAKPVASFIHPMVTGTTQTNSSNVALATIVKERISIHHTDCIGGIPRNIAKNLPQAAPVFADNPLDLPANLAVVRLDDNGMLPAPRQRTTLTGSSPFFDTLFASDSAHYQQNRKNLQSRHVSAQQTLIQFEAEEAFTEAVKPTVPCPRCSAPPPAPPPLFNPALMPLGGLGLPVPGGMNPMGFPMPIVKPQAPPPSNQAPPNIPAPPMLSVVMMRSPDNPDMQVPMVDLPGIGLVPAEQILKMQVPMVVMPNIAPNMMPDSGNDRDEGDAQSHAESDGISETEKDEVLRNVWG
ncbi:hypothetical protein CcCBS67573_g00377 [Chytriomyces confervae]|uniref:Uncharacterized protein n=1 Tax=Chytriomyces confervae TaxID=246404 RepID=A0A507FUP3_9FUNG|nr:hypothetical protein CcCBS67573_g00377 [Chytriomyces confervae]